LVTPKHPPQTELAKALTSAEWARVDEGVERALEWLADQQQSDGSFPTRPQAQPAVTGLAVMAFLSCGHQPGQGRYGEAINRAIDFVLSCQQESGLFSYETFPPVHESQRASHMATYNHAIAGLALCEVYGQVTRERSAKIEASVNRALAFTARMQVEPPKRSPEENGGWRYLYETRNTPSRSDLSVTGWHLMFLRSAKNAQFNIPDEEITSAVAYVERSFDQGRGVFVYGLIGQDRYSSRGMMGAGILSLSLAGKHHTEMARAAGDWILANPFDVYGQTTDGRDRFHYSAYYCSNALAQLGGHYWTQSFPMLSRTLLDAQSPEGYWAAESGRDANLGSAYPTALSVMALTPAYQLLPIYQR
jgi:hypothetical protein